MPAPAPPGDSPVGVSLFFYPLSALAAAYLVTYGLEDHLPDGLMAVPVCWYLASAALDIAGTARAGRAAVSARETAAPFRVITGRFGLRAAIPAQVAIELLAATVAVPVVLGHGPLHPPSVAIFCVMAAAFHTYGYLSNRRSYPETGAGHTPIKSSDAGASARVGHPSG